ncbi:hypothetical protein KI811_11205 [Geobacter hydrogenophilus]|uniref:Uncharacterized protein n=1 Tax=Geobacter hydrogenophilus TaxID=40983 RepID=A0A9W6G0P0_9BACT|nr:hypothetical protein [Geobacter hydrogenophilus]MBT0894375.1 hypothetical protein [Geobacter hydrogenophilus]GLI38336.1 hypothetical protein GHYDROH2_18370 [Geobacter hydrogenophilus]
MRKISYGVVVLWMLLCSGTPASAQVSIGIGLPHVSIGINLPLYPELVPVPGYPVYYAPRVAANYFFYDGLYWIYLDDDWYASYWYNGPWWIVEPDVIPVYILRIPVRYYRHPPPYFRGWRQDAPPRWGTHWGREWEQHRRGWDKWKRSSAPSRAPLPVYQRQYSGDRYPTVEQQQAIRREHYRYQPRDKAVRQHFQPRGEQQASPPAQRGREEERRIRTPKQQREQKAPVPAQKGRQEERRIRAPEQQGESNAPRSQQPHRPPQERGSAGREQRRLPEGAQQERQAPRSHGEEQRIQREQPQERGQGQERRQMREEERGR